MTEDVLKVIVDRMKAEQEREAAMTEQEKMERRQNYLVQECNRILADPNKPNVPTVQPLVDAYYALGNWAGGSLHIALEDCNVKDRDVQWCVENAEKDGDCYGVLLGKVLLRMSKTQRLKLKSGL